MIAIYVCVLVSAAIYNCDRIYAVCVCSSLDYSTINNLSCVGIF
jgi:hypothetical protein